MTKYEIRQKYTEFQNTLFILEYLNFRTENHNLNSQYHSAVFAILGDKYRKLHIYRPGVNFFFSSEGVLIMNGASIENKQMGVNSYEIF